MIIKILVIIIIIIIVIIITFKNYFLIDSEATKLEHRNKLFQFHDYYQYYYTVEPRFTSTPLIWPPRYYGHFILA